MKRNLWAYACDHLSYYLVGDREASDRSAEAFHDVDIRTSPKWKDVYGDQAVYKLVAKLFCDLEFEKGNGDEDEDGDDDEALEYGRWWNIEIMDGVDAKKAAASINKSHEEKHIK